METIPIEIISRIAQRGLNKRELLVILGIISYGSEGAPSPRELADLCGVHRNHVGRTVSALVDRGFVSHGRRITLTKKLVGAPISNIYILNTKKEEDIYLKHILEDRGCGGKKPFEKNNQNGCGQTEGDGLPSKFEEFWDAFPRRRRGSKREATKSWRKHKCEAMADKIIAHVKLHSASNFDWLRGFPPMATTYLNQHQWENELPVVPDNEWRKAGIQAPLTDSKWW